MALTDDKGAWAAVACSPSGQILASTSSGFFQTAATHPASLTSKCTSDTTTSTSSSASRTSNTSGSNGGTSTNTTPKTADTPNGTPYACMPKLQTRTDLSRPPNYYCRFQIPPFIVPLRRRHCRYSHRQHCRSCRNRGSSLAAVSTSKATTTLSRSACWQRGQRKSHVFTCPIPQPG